MTRSFCLLAFTLFGAASACAGMSTSSSPSDPPITTPAGTTGAAGSDQGDPPLGDDGAPVPTDHLDAGGADGGATTTTGGPPIDGAPPTVPTVMTNGVAHPGMMTTSADLAAIAGHIARGEAPWAAQIPLMKALVGRPGRVIHNPGVENKVGGGALIYCGSYNKNAAGDAKVLACDWPVENGIDAYTFALLGYFTRDAAYSEQAMRILEAWTDPTHFAGFDPAGSNAPLQHGWALPWYANAAELLRYTYAAWDAGHTKAVEGFLARMLPLVTRDDQGAPNNWLHSRIEAHMAAAIFLSDKAMLDTTVTRWKTHTRSYVYIDADNGTPVLPSSSLAGARGKGIWSTPKFVAGMTMETCRDLGHQALGMRSIFNSLAMATNQGIDMFTGNDNRERLSKFLEVMPVWAQSKTDNPDGICNAPVIVTPPSTYLRDTAERVPFEIAFDLLYTAQRPLDREREDIQLSAPRGASRWVTKWETLTHRSSNVH